MQKDWKKLVFEGNFSSAGRNTVNMFSLMKEENKGHRSGGTGSGRAHLTHPEWFVPNRDQRCTPEKKWDKGKRIWYFLLRMSRFLRTFHFGNFLSQLWSVFSNIQCLSLPGFSLPWAHVSVPHQHWFLLVLVGKEFQGQLAIAKTTYFVSYKPVCHVSLNK